MNLERFKPEDLREILPQDQQADELARVLPIADKLAEHLAYTARVGSEVVAIAGVVSVSKDVGYLWAVMSRGAGKHFVRLHKMARRLIETCGKARLLADTERSFAAGCRWLALLGFEVLEDGETIIYRKVCTP